MIESATKSNRKNQKFAEVEVTWRESMKKELKARN